MRDKELGLLWTSCFQEPKDSDSDDERQQIEYNQQVYNRYTNK